jgi:hypothetical protein
MGPGGHFQPVTGPEEFWRSAAFATADDVAGEGVVDVLGSTFAFPPEDWSLPGEPRLRRFHLHYGEEVLGWARRGDREQARQGLEAWMEGNPPRPDDAWHPYPLSTRVGNWVAALSLMPELADSTVTRSLRRQLRYLRRNIEDDVLGNHVIRNARALVLAGTALNDGPALRHGLELLRREVPEQVLPDGGHYERSPVYHLLVLRDLLEIRAAVEAPWLDEPLERMQAFAAAATRPDGSALPFNDAPVELAPSLSLPAVPKGLSVFPDTGLVTVLDGDLWLAVDCGAPAPVYLPPHAHADTLSFELWHRGEPVVVDPGSYTYDAGADRNWFRGTRAHSTVALDGRDQFELWGAFRAGPFPKVELLRADPGGIEAAVSWAGGAKHLRRLTWTSEEVRVEDDVIGLGRRRIASRLQLASDAVVEALGPLPPQRVEGWVSDRLFSRREAAAFECEGELELPVSMGWIIRLAG